jgi:hypothetical protein
VNREPSHPAFFDPTWLFVLAGVAMLAATVLVAAQDDIDDARFARDQVLAVEAHRETRLNNYKEFLAALDERQPALIESLASSQLNQIPAERAAIPGTVHDNTVDASVFPALEPPPVQLPQRTRVDSVLRTSRHRTQRASGCSRVRRCASCWACCRQAANRAKPCLREPSRVAAAEKNRTQSKTDFARKRTAWSRLSCWLQTKPKSLLCAAVTRDSRSGASLCKFVRRVHA